MADSGQQLVLEWRRSVGCIGIPERDYYDASDYASLAARIDLLVLQKGKDLAHEEERLRHELQECHVSCMQWQERAARAEELLAEEREAFQGHLDWCDP